MRFTTIYIASKKILKKSFPKILSLYKVFGTATLLLLGNPSYGVDLPGTSVFFSNAGLSSNVIYDLNHGSNAIQSLMDEATYLFSSPISAPAPAPSDVLVCEGGNTTLTVSGGSTYQWKISTNNGVTWTNITGQNSSSLTLNNVTYSMNGNMYSCMINGIQNSSTTLTVVRYPSAADIINATTPVCQGAVNIPYSVPLIANATQYIWTLPSGATIISGELTKSIFVNFSSFATSGIISVKGNNSCGDGLPSSSAVTVNHMPDAAGSITGPSSICQGSNGITYSINPVTHANSYVWIVPPGGTIVSQIATPVPTIIVNFSNSASPGNVTVYGVNGCGNGTSSAPFSVNFQTVIPLSAGPVDGPSTVCQGEHGVTYSISPITNATGYIWSVPPGGTIVTQSTAPIPNITVNFSNAAAAGNVSVYGVNGCGSGAASTTSVSVRPLPSAAGNITGQSTVCQGNVGITYSVAPITNTVGYAWTLPSGASIANGANTNSITVNFSTSALSGNVSVYGINGCGNGVSSIGYPVTVNPLPVAAGIISGPASICPGQTGTIYTVPTITNANTYHWSLPTGATIVSGGNTSQIMIDYSPTFISGNLSVYGSNGCGNGAVSANYAVTVNSPPGAAGNISGSAAVCQGQSGVIYTVPLIQNATDYIWSLPTGAAIISGAHSNQITVNYSNTAFQGNITVYGRNSCGDGAISSYYAVAVNPLPVAAGIISGDNVVCQGQTNVQYTVPVIANATGYTWILPSGATITSGANTNSITVNFSTSALSGNVSVYGINGCGNGVSSIGYPVTVNPLPAAAGIISGSASICPGQTGTIYSVPTITNTNTYHWSVPTGASIVSGGNTSQITVDFSPTFISGNFSVYGSNGCGNGAVSANYAVTVNSTPGAAGNITGRATVCQGQSGVSYSVPLIPNATDYIWSVPASATIVSGAHSNQITVNYLNTAVAGNITVYGKNTCDVGAISANYFVAVNNLPDAAGIISGDNNVVCQGQTDVLYTVPAIANATGYTWLLPIGATIISGSNSNSIRVSFSNTAQSGNISVQGTNACGNGSFSLNFSVTVNPLPDAAGNITGPTHVCYGQTEVPFSITPVNHATGYVWTLPPGATISSGSNGYSITVDFSATAISGNVSVYGTTSCGSGLSSANFPVTVQSTPGGAGAITGPPNVCQGQTSVSYSVPAIPYATDYIWNLPTGATITAGSNTRSILVSYSATASPGSVTVYGSNSCGTGTSSTLPIDVRLLPIVPGTITGLATFCEGATGIVYSVPSIANATGYTWNVPSGAVITDGSNTQTITVSFPSGTNSGNISVYGINSCGNSITSSVLSVTVSKLPVTPGIIIGPANVCQNQTGAIYTVPAIGNATAYIWSVPSGATITSGSTTNSITVSFSAIAVSGDITVQGTNACGSGPVSAGFPIIVNTLPAAAAGVISGVSPVCQGQNGVVYSVPAILRASQYDWIVPAGVNIVSGQGTPNITVNFAATAVADNIQVSGHNSCGDGTPSTFAFGVDPLPVGAGAITGATTVCQGQTAVTYTVPLITNATGYIWSLPLGATIALGANTNSITVNYSPISSSGGISVQGINACGSGVVSPNLAVTVQTVPTLVGVITGSAVVCQGQNNVTYTIPVIANATGYVWTTPSGATIIGGSNTNTIIVNFSATASSGNLSVYGINACGNSTVSNLPITVESTPAAAGIITGNPALCQGTSNVPYTVPVIANASGYTWNLPAGVTIVAGDNTNAITVNFSSIATSGNISVYGTNSCGNGPVSAGYPVTVSLLPVAAGAINGPSSVCQGSTGKVYSVPVVPNAVSYFWTLPSGASIVSGGNTNTATINFSNSASSGVITVNGVNGCGNGATSANFDISMNLLPDAAGAITGANNVCFGTTDVIYSVAAITNATGYSWTVPAGASITAGANTNSIMVTYSSSALSGDITVRGTNACENGVLSANFPVIIQSLPTAAGSISGTPLVCQGQSNVSYSVPAIANATGYIWTLPFGASIESGSNTNSITVNYSSSATTGVVKVYGTNSCGNGVVSADYPVTISLLPAAANTISGYAVVCPGASGIVYSIPAISNATSYAWTPPNGASITSGSGTNSITVDFSLSATNDSISVSGINGCGIGTAASLNITVNPPPVLTSTLTPATICSNSLFSYIPTSSTPGTIFEWSRAAFAGISNLSAFGTDNPNETLVNTTTSPITVTYVYVLKIRGCTNSNPYKVIVTINPTPPPPVITPNMNPICEGSTFSLKGEPSGMTSYSWVGPNGFTSTVQNPLQISNVSLAAAGAYKLTVTNQIGCLTYAEITQVINSASFNGTYGPYCLSDSPVNLSASPAGGTFSGPGVTGNSFDPQAAGVGSHTISYSSPGGSCQVAPIIINVVLSTPVVKTNNTKLKSCNGTTDLTLPEVTAGSLPGLIFTYWADSEATQPLANPKAVGAGTYYIKGATLSGGCFDIQTVIVNQSDAFQAKLTSVSPPCIGSASGSISVTVTKGMSPFTYQWNTNPVQTTSTIKDLKAGIYSVTVTDANLCSVTLTDTLKDHANVRIYITRKDIQCQNDANGSARVDSINGSGKPFDLNLFSYKWNTTPIQTTREATRLSYGYYTVTMTDAKGCGIKDSVLINVLDTIPPTIECRTDTMAIVIQSGTNDLLATSTNTVVVELGKPVVWDNCGVASLTNDAPEKYRVGITEVNWTVTDFVGLSATCKQIVYIKYLPIIPKLFSPNGDGINDFFEIDGLKDFPKSQLYVYTRSGQLVFSSEDYKSEWDGRFQTSKWSHNQIVAPGVYFYILNLGGTTQKLQGFVYIYY